jgi:hypothetical protein
MADVTRKQDFVLRFASDVMLAIGQMTVPKRRVDTDFVLSIRHSAQLLMRQAEAPCFPVVTRSVGNPIGTVLKGKEMFLELLKRKSSPKRNAVADDVQVTCPEVNHFLALRILDVSISDVPFFRDGPVEYRGSSRNLLNFKRDMLLYESKSLSNTFPGDTAANRVQPAYEIVYLRS